MDLAFLYADFTGKGLELETAYHKVDVYRQPIFLIEDQEVKFELQKVYLGNKTQFPLSFYYDWLFEWGIITCVVYGLFF